MIAISGYQFGELIHESGTSLVYRGRRRADDKPVILKTLKDPYPSPEQIARIKNEYQIINSLDLRGVIKAYGLEKNQQRWVLVLEDFGGTSLAHLQLAGNLTLTNFFTLAIRITEVLGQLHHKHIIHKDVNPSNILTAPFHPQQDKISRHTQWPIKLTDFGIAVRLVRENPVADTSEGLQGTLAYISPEQTGRMNRTVDYRTDFYSLGATFYELLIGQPPFTSTDPLELVHSHIAKQPVPLHTLKSDVPLALSEIVTKLVAKNAEDRYQSSYGLKSDLEECLRQWQATQKIESFPLGRQDVSDQVNIPHKLYGREQELEELQNIFTRVSQGAGDIVLVSGHVGIGKSALVHDLYKPVTGNRGFFISGKFDHLQRNTPYAPLIEAFHTLVQQLLAENKTQIAAWKEKLLAALAPNAQIIIDVIPEIELIIGPQPPVQMLGPVEAQNRFNLVFQQFIKVFATPEHPLVIFLDDLQWADDASLELIKLLITAPESDYLLLIGAYRDNEVGQNHPLLRFRDSIKPAIDIKEIVLPPLPLPHITRLVVDALHCWPRQAAPLAELLREKTGGNPYFMGEFLKSLYNKQLITFDAWRGTWQWDLAQIRTQEITDNVVDLMAEKIKNLPAETQEILKLASCVGHQFDLDTVSIIAQKAADDITADLWPAINDGLLLLVSRQYKFTEADVEGVITAEYKFAHNRMQQAVYSLISEKNKQTVHWRIGQLLLRHTLPDKRSERIFDLVNQMNLGRAACVEQTEWDELAGLNLLAGQKAKTSAAYHSALNYLKVGIELVQQAQSPLLRGSEQPDCWQRQYDLTLQLYVEALEAAYLATDFEQMEQFAEVVLDKAQILLDKVKVYEVKLLAYIAQNKLQHLIDTALSVLKLLAVRLPTEPGREHIAQALGELEAALANRPVEELASLPKMADAYRLAAMRLLSIVSSVAYFDSPDLLPFLVLKMVTQSIEHGNAPESALAYANYGLILCGRMGDIDTGGQFGELALKVSEQFNAQELKARTHFAVNAFIKHWQRHIRDGLTPLQNIYRNALDVGDLDYATRSLFTYGLHAYFVGKNLANLEQDMARHSETMSRLKQAGVLRVNQLYYQTILNLMGESEDPCYLTDENYNEEQIRSLQVETVSKSAIFHLYFNKLVLCYLSQQHQQAVDSAGIARKYLNSVTANPAESLFYFYDSLARLALLSETPETDEATREQILQQVAANQKKLNTWAQYATMNYLHKYYLVEAEYARVLGKDGNAREYYDRAVALAQQNQYTNEEALANELAAHFYFAKNQPDIANVYLHKAHYAYLQWGAKAKVNTLEAHHPQLKMQVQLTPTTSTVSVTSTPHTQSNLGVLDLSSVIRASQIISGEIMLDSLLSKMMSIVIENAGAQKGYLFLEKDDDWSIEASGAVSHDDVAVVQSIPLKVAAYGRNPIVPGAIINYVIRSRESVVLNNATTESQYARDAYIAAAQPKSVLCMPLVTQGKLIGIVYLENNLSTGAFTPDRRELLNILSSQAAISIENARFYAHQIELTRAYSRFVPREFLHFLRKDSITQVQLGDQIQQQMTVLFSDIRAFTDLSEQMSPQENFNFINAYLRRVSPIIREHNGFIDKYMGDAIMALFPTNANDAIQAAIAMQQEVNRYNLQRLEKGYQSIKIGIGLHTGMVMLGTIGEAQRMEGTVISDAVNLAARLEGLTKLYGSSIVISGEMMFSLDNPTQYTFRFLDKVKVKGKDEAVSIFEVLDGEPEESVALTLKTQDTFERGLLHYHTQEFDKAKDYFMQTLDINPNDQATQLYLRRVQNFIEYGVPPDWEGVAVLTEK